MQDLEKIRKELSSPKKIFITTHHKPDGDAMGSSLGLYHYLLKKGHDAFLITPTDYAVYLHWLPGNDAVINYLEQKEKALKYLEECDLIFCLDFNSLSRINELGDHVRNSSAKKIMIDHHLEPEGFDDCRYWNPDASATCELVYDLITGLDGLEILDKKICTCLYTGTVTDTGSFRFPATSAKVHHMAGEFLARGVDHSKVHQMLFDDGTAQRLKFIGYCLKEKMVVLEEFQTAYISITQDELKEYGIKTGDSEGLVNFPLSIGKVVLSALIVDRGEKVKLSLRSKGSFPANEICRRFFNGGGHLNAAGGSSDESLDATVEKFVSILPEYKDLINII